MKLVFKRIPHLEQVPNQLERAHSKDAGADIRCTEDVLVRPKESAIIPTGIAVDIPEGYEGQVRPRSGLGFKYDTVAFSGTVDAGFNGHLQVKIFNFGCNPIMFNKGDRVAQLVVAPVVLGTFEEVEQFQVELDNDAKVRGSSGFGSSGLQ
jgi:dUTP pyrophosphatase